jgi:hypothetical protein
MMRLNGSAMERRTLEGESAAGNPSAMDRREFLQRAACAAALPGAAEFFRAWLASGHVQQHGVLWQPPESPLLRDYTPKFFVAADFDALRALTEILIPTDDTPGAREAHCAHFIDFILQASPSETQQQWRHAMDALKTSGFHDADASRRLAIVDAMARPERDQTATHPAYFAYRLIKQQNTFAFYTSRAGLIETLDYKGNSFNATFPACDHEEHKSL